MDSKEPQVTTVYTNGNRWGRWLVLILALGVLLFLVLWTMGDLPDRIARWDAFGDNPSDDTVKWIRLVLLAVLGASIGALGVQAWRWWPRSRPRVVEIPRYERRTDSEGLWTAADGDSDEADLDQGLVASSVSDRNAIVASRDEKIPVYNPDTHMSGQIDGSQAVNSGSVSPQDWAAAGAFDSDDAMYDDPLIVHPRSTDHEPGILRVVGDTTVGTATGSETQAVTESAERAADSSAGYATSAEGVEPGALSEYDAASGITNADQFGDAALDGESSAAWSSLEEAMNAEAGNAAAEFETASAETSMADVTLESDADGPRHEDGATAEIELGALIEEPGTSSDMADVHASLADGTDEPDLSADAELSAGSDLLAMHHGDNAASDALDALAAASSLTAHDTNGLNGEVPGDSSAALTFDLPEAAREQNQNASPFGSAADPLGQSMTEAASSTQSDVVPEITWAQTGAAPLDVSSSQHEATATHQSDDSTSAGTGDGRWDGPTDLDFSIADEQTETGARAESTSDSGQISALEERAADPQVDEFEGQHSSPDTSTAGQSNTSGSEHAVQVSASEAAGQAADTVGDQPTDTGFAIDELEALVFNVDAGDRPEQISSALPSDSLFENSSANEDEPHFSADTFDDDSELAPVAELHEKRASRERAPMSAAHRDAAEPNEDAILNVSTQTEVASPTPAEFSATASTQVTNGGDGQRAAAAAESTSPTSGRIADSSSPSPRPLSDVLGEVASDTEETTVSLSKAECAALLQRSNLQGIDFNLVDFSGLTLRGVDMSGSSLRSASLEGTDLRGSRLIDVDLTGVLAKGSFLRGVRLEGARMAGVDLTDSDMGGVYAPTLDMHGAMLSGASLRGAILPQAELSGADLAGVDAQGADLGEAALVGASLQGAVLRGANLQGTDLRGADLRGADLRGSDLAGANLRGTDLEGAFSDNATRWPDGIDPDAEGVRIAERHSAA